jgi:hypothetical protein
MDLPSGKGWIKLPLKSKDQKLIDEILREDKNKK